MGNPHGAKAVVVRRVPVEGGNVNMATFGGQGQMIGGGGNDQVMVIQDERSGQQMTIIMNEGAAGSRRSRPPPLEPTRDMSGMTQLQ